MSIQFIQTSIKTSKQLNNIFLEFSVTDICSSVIPFFCSTYCTKVCFLLPPQDLIPSRGSAYWLIGSTWQVGCPPTWALKCWMNRYMQVRQNLHMLSLLSVFTYWGGEPWCYCIIYLLISFVAVILGSIHSQFSVFTHWGAVILGLTSSTSC